MKLMGSNPVIFLNLFYFSYKVYTTCIHHTDSLSIFWKFWRINLRKIVFFLCTCIIIFLLWFLDTFLWSFLKPENLHWCLALEVFSQWAVSPFYGVHAIICNTYSPKIGFLSHLCTLEHLQQLCILLWDFKVICWLLWQLSDKWLLYYGLS